MTGDPVKFAGWQHPAVWCEARFVWLKPIVVIKRGVAACGTYRNRNRDVHWTAVAVGHSANFIIFLLFTHRPKWYTCTENLHTVTSQAINVVVDSHIAKRSNRNNILSKWYQVQQSRPASYCRVLSPDKFNGMKPEPLTPLFWNFIKIVATVCMQCCSQWEQTLRHRNKQKRPKRDASPETGR